MTQTRLESLIEAIVNAVIGMGVGLASQIVIFYALGVKATISQNLWMVLWFTLISVARSYIIRRWFNERLHRMVKNIAHAVEEAK